MYHHTIRESIPALNEELFLDQLTVVALVAEDGQERQENDGRMSHQCTETICYSGDVNEWFKRFEICCKANGWTNATSALKLPTLLEGEALAIWLELSEEQ